MTQRALSVEQARALIQRPRRSKFNAVRCVDDMGVLYDSQAERAYAETLRQKVWRGEIEWWSFGPRFVLQPDPLVTYRPDYLVQPKGGSLKAIDVKGVQTQRFRLVVKLWRGRYPHMPLVLIKNGVEVPA